MKIKIGCYSLKIEIMPTVAYLCLLTLLISLGVWQMNRSEQKFNFLKLEEQRINADVLELTPAAIDQADTLRYRKVTVKGVYDSSHQYLLDNQVSDGKVGYFVLTPFLLQGQSKAVLVNRGWLPMGLNRSNLPMLPIDQELTSITGRINHFPSVGIKLAGAETPSDKWPSVVQVVNSDVLAKKLGYSLFTFQVELDKELPDGFKREWHVTTLMMPEQHIAYAIQWFLLALTLSIIFIWYSLKRNNE